MKIITILFLFLTHSFTWAINTDVDELGRSLANYQACSKVSFIINDDQMFDYYQKMFNDSSLSLLSLKRAQASQVYGVWDESEKVLENIEQQSLKEICLSRFGELSRQMLNQIERKQ